MLKNKILKNLLISCLCFLIIFIINIFPNNNKKYIIHNTHQLGYIYLLDNNDYISKLEIVYSSNKTIDNIKEIIELLTINNKNPKLRNGFSPIIPEKTKLLSLSINNKTAILNFSKEILTISKTLEDKMIESIVYSITSLNGIANIEIQVEGTTLTKLPHSNKELPKTLDRSIGINIISKLTNYNDIVKTTIYYLAKLNDYTYYIPVTLLTNDKKEKVEIIIEELKTSSIYNTNLISYLHSELKLISYNITDKSLILNFNESIFTDINSNTINEEVLYTIRQSIKENYNINNIIYNVNNEMI